MTLVLALANVQQVVQISDRRLVAGTQVVSDESGKAGVVVCPDARLVFGYSGLAQVGSFKTQEWLLNTLLECAAPDYSVRNILQRLEARLTDKFRSLPLKFLAPERRRLSIMFTGYFYGASKPSIVNVILTNFQDFISRQDSAIAWDTFQGLYQIWDLPSEEDPTVIQRIGQWSALPEQKLQPFREMLEKRARESGMVGRAVAIFNTIADSPSYESVGKQITSTSISVDPSKPARGGYHSAENSSRLFFPDFVSLLPGQETAVADAHLAIHDERGMPGILVTPRVQRNDPCPCGRRKPYWKCHGSGC